MTSEEKWTIEEQKLKSAIAQIEQQIDIAEIDFHIAQDDRKALLRHKQNQLVELGKRKPKTKADVK